ncbi:MAG TPA: flagellar biosynthetic protein FliO [Pseudolabrys sp.]|nr:flagellar biosynthetic protein FliO [Pseudolabrys sp.]
MFETLLGYEIPLAARFFIAFLVVLGLIGLTAWLVRRFGANRLGGSARGRQPRLAVIDAASVDGRRRLVLIRRDNIEHLLMIGGPSDVVIEPNIVRAVGAREVARDTVRAAETPAPAPAAPTPARASSAAPETSWPLQPASEPAPRPYRTNVTDEPWLAPEPGARARPASSDSLTGFAAEFSARMNQRETATPPVQPEPQRIAPVAPAEPIAPPQTDHNLAEMALQLEAALRRPPENRPPVTDPLAVPSAPPVAKAPEPPRAREIKPRVEPRVEPRIEPRAEQKATKTSFDNLEQEMASLLGRPSGKT